jgi:hypothetical protein
MTDPASTTEKAMADSPKDDKFQVLDEAGKRA